MSRKLSSENTLVYIKKYRKKPFFGLNFVKFCKQQASNPVVVLVTLVTLSRFLSVTAVIQCPSVFEAL